ncbi:PDZ domain-containing protein [Lentzea tibetensis]|uniref:PDZ domain-containing protein n=1 Tax=Lentzea tibetensis TaxID=2591470 RepID=A0A563EQC0_9PSEU|nr:trypsin-like peptidase domain-containing protein [Lentzea tibetensis]TWP49929.1 PDZ domain-containing protein [Lentzea tibetensis]
MTESNQPAPQPEPNPWQRDAGQADSGAGVQGSSQPEPGQPDPLQGGSGQPGHTQQLPAADARAAQENVAQPGQENVAQPAHENVAQSSHENVAQPGHESAGQVWAHQEGPGPQGQPGPYYAPPGYQPPPAPLAGPAARGRSKVVAGVAALVLAVGGLSGALGGYIGHQFARETSSANALNAPKPIQQTGNVSQGSIEAVASQVLPSVVQIQVTTGRGAGEGSGFITSADGQIVTNNHVIEGAVGGAGQIKVVFQDGKTASAKVLGRDPSSDVAVIKADGVADLPIVQLGSSSDLKIGQQVVAIGSPFELSGTVTSGIVSSLNRPVSAGGESDNRSQATVLNAIQTDAAINPGNSGGPLVNMQGQVVGINSAIYSPNSANGQAGSVGIGFAIPIDQARRTAEDIVKTGKAKQTVLGVEVTGAENGGAKVGKVTSGGAAEKAGIKVGDVITKFGDRRIDSSDTLVAAVRSKAPDEKVTITLSDGRTVEATLGGVEVE